MSLYLLYQINRHQHVESCRRWNYSGPYCDSNMKSETETYASHLVFSRIISLKSHLNLQEVKGFLPKMIRIMIH